LLSVFQRKNKKPEESMLENFITSALVIDDDKTEVDSLIQYLEDKDIWTKYYHPNDLEGKEKQFNNRKLIFLDLYLKDEQSSVENIALIRRYFKNIIGENFGTYGIVLWTKHTNHFDEFCNKIYQQNNPFSAPLFVIALEKNKYKTQGNYNGVLDELEKKLKEDISSSFFVEWNKSVKQGSDNTILGLYDLFDNYKKKNQNLEAVLYSLACNYTGIPKEASKDYDLQKDLVKSLMDALQFEVSGSFQNIDSLFSDDKKLNFNDSKEEKAKVFAKLNTLLMLDFQNLHQDHSIPGNVYEINDRQNSLYISTIIKNRKGKQEEIDLADKINKRVVLEITPPCDFAQAKKQKQSRIIGGIMLDYDKDLVNHFGGDNFYSYLLPVSISSQENPQMIIFDFYRFLTLNEEELKNKTKYPIFFRTKDKLFADILQKLSSHTARLGIAIMYP
jgi:hypothetical protein